MRVGASLAETGRLPCEFLFFPRSKSSFQPLLPRFSPLLTCDCDMPFLHSNAQVSNLQFCVTGALHSWLIPHVGTVLVVFCTWTAQPRASKALLLKKNAAGEAGTEMTGMYPRPTGTLGASASSAPVQQTLAVNGTLFWTHAKQSVTYSCFFFFQCMSSTSLLCVKVVLLGICECFITTQVCVFPPKSYV